MNTTNIIWSVIALVAMCELARLYYRIHMLEANLDTLVTAIEKAIRSKR